MRFGASIAFVILFTVGLPSAAADSGSNPFIPVANAIGDMGHTSFRVSGYANSDKYSIKVDLELSKTEASGTVSVNNNPISLRRINKTIYEDPSYKLLRALGVKPKNALKIAAHWFQIPNTNSESYESVANLLMLGGPLLLVSSSGGGTTTQLPPAVIDHREVQVFEEVFQSAPNSPVTYSLSGADSPVFVRIARHGDSVDAVLNFSDYGFTPHVKRPKHYVIATPTPGLTI